MLDSVLIARDEEFRRHVSEVLRRPDSHARLVLDLPSAADELPREALSRILAAKPQVVFVDLGEESTTGLRVVKALSQDAPEVPLVVAGPALGAEALLDVMRSGASEYLPRPIDLDDTLGAYRRVRRRMAPVAPEATGQRGSVITVFSAKGGTGVTTIAASLAALLRMHTEKSTLLLDLAPALGTAALAMGLRPRYSYLDVIHNFHRIDEELLESFLEVADSGVSVLPSPTLAPDAAPPTADEMLGLLRLCQRHFAWVVVDAGAVPSATMAAVLSESEHRVAVCTPEIPTLRNLKRALEMVDGVALNGSGPPKIVLNQYRDGTGVTPREVEDALDRSVFATLVWDAEGAVQGLNLAQPLATSANRSKLGRDITRLGERLVGISLSHSGRGLGSLFRPLRDRTSRK